MNEKISCQVIGDLFPVYQEGLCSDETKHLVEEHLKTCAECRKLYAAFPEHPDAEPPADPPAAKTALKKVRRRSRIRKVAAGCGLTLLTLLLLALGIFCYGLGYAPLVGKLIAQSKLSAYSGGRIHCRFDWYNGQYVSEGGGLAYRLRNDFILDYALSGEKLNALNEQYAAFRDELTAEGLEPAEQIGSFTVVSGKDLKTQYHRIYWYVWDAREMSKGEAYKNMAELTERMLAAFPDEKITGQQFRYCTLSGSYQSLVETSSEPLNSTSVLQGVTEDERLPEDYLAWRDMHKKTS